MSSTLRVRSVIDFQQNLMQTDASNVTFLRSGKVHKRRDCGATSVQRFRRSRGFKAFRKLRGGSTPVKSRWSRARACDVEQMTFARVDLFEVRFITDRLCFSKIG